MHRAELLILRKNGCDQKTDMKRRPFQMDNITAELLSAIAFVRIRVLIDSDLVLKEATSNP